MKKTCLLLAAFLLFSTLLSACSSAPTSFGTSAATSSNSTSSPTSPPNVSEVYLLTTTSDNTNIHHIALDRDGNVLMEGDNLEVMNDEITGEARFIVSGQNTYDEAVSHYPELVASAVYGLDGSMLIDFSPVQYRSGIGNCLVKSPLPLTSSSGERALFDVYTGETISENCSYVHPASPQTAALNNAEGIYALVDSNLQIVHEFDDTQRYAQLNYMQGYYAASMPGGDFESKMVLLDENFEKVFDDTFNEIKIPFASKEHMELISHGEDGTGGKAMLWNYKTREVAFEWNPSEQSLYYCTGQVAGFAGGGLNSEILTDMQGNVLGEYDRIVSSDFSNSGDPGEGFLFAQKGETFYKLSPAGEVLEEKQMPGYRLMNNIVSNCFSASLQTGAMDSTSLFGVNFEEIIPAEKYLSLSGEYINGTPYIRAQHAPSNAVMSLLDTSGNVVLGDIIFLSGVLGERMLVDWQGKRGMIDVDGNWYYQTEIPADVLY